MLIQQKLDEDLKTVDKLTLAGPKKVWIYENYMTSQFSWPFLVYDLDKTVLKTLDAMVTKFLKSWLGVARQVDPSLLYRSTNNFGLNYKRPSTVYAKLRITKHYILKQSKDDLIMHIDVDSDKMKNLESRLQFHKAFLSGTGQGRSGLGTLPRPTDKELLKQFVERDAEHNYTLHATGLEIQNDWLSIGDYCIPLALKWRSVLYNWSPELLKFYLNAFQLSLPDPSNLVRWGKADDKRCQKCQVDVCTTRHILTGCKAELDAGLYSYRHDRVLEIIREALSLAVARSKKGLTQSSGKITFVKEGGKAGSQKDKPSSIIEKADDWSLLMDTYEKHYTMPDQLCVTSRRPDILLYSMQRKLVFFVELTVPWETNIPKDHEYKMNKYYDLVDGLIRKGLRTRHYAVEMGARGLPAKSLYSLLKDLGLPRSSISTFLERMTKAALAASYRIWLGRGCDRI